MLEESPSEESPSEESPSEESSSEELLISKLPLPSDSIESLPVWGESVSPGIGELPLESPEDDSLPSPSDEEDDSSLCVGLLV